MAQKCQICFLFLLLRKLLFLRSRKRNHIWQLHAVAVVFCALYRWIQPIFQWSCCCCFHTACSTPIYDHVCMIRRELFVAFIQNKRLSFQVSVFLKTYLMIPQLWLYVTFWQVFSICRHEFEVMALGHELTLQCKIASHLHVMKTRVLQPRYFLWLRSKADHVTNQNQCQSCCQINKKVANIVGCKIRVYRGKI